MSDTLVAGIGGPVALAAGLVASPSAFGRVGTLGSTATYPWPVSACALEYSIASIKASLNGERILVDTATGEFRAVV